MAWSNGKVRHRMWTPDQVLMPAADRTGSSVPTQDGVSAA
jgi:hypothetical protein